jgi:hypothetical protein
MRWYVGAIAIGLLGIYVLCTHWMREMKDRAGRLEQKQAGSAINQKVLPALPVIKGGKSEVLQNVSATRLRPKGRISFDCGAPLFGSYDASFIATVEQRWYDLVDKSKVAGVGKVKFGFEILPDGKLANVQMIEGEIGSGGSDLCKEALVGPVHLPWPAEMVKAIGTGPRRVTMTFFYP